MSDHRPMSFDDADDPRPFKRGELKQFKRRLAEHAKESGNSEMAIRMGGWGRRALPGEGGRKKDEG